MSQRPLIIHKDVQARIDAAVEQAKAKPTPWETLQPFAIADPSPELKMKDRKSGNKELMDKLVNRSQFVEIPVGYLAAISFEYQPAGLCRHLSISVSASAQGRMPSFEAVKMIAEAFGFKMPLEGSCRLWCEEFAPQEYAVNIVQIEEPSDARPQ
jgi:hypothetical protein